MKHRNYIPNQKFIELYEESDEKSAPVKRKFQIKEKIGDDGSSSVCYKAECRSKIGVLKELYPIDENYLIRDKNNYLIPKLDDYKTTFENKKEDFIKPYKIVTEARKKEELSSFLPDCEIYYSGENGVTSEGSVYIWTPQMPSETFDKTCKENHDFPDEKPEYKLVKTLYSIRSLVEGVCALHEANIIHRDIKPSNFGFPKVKGKVNTHSISLFDLDTICHVYDVPKDETRGTAWYMEPEALCKGANNLTDIYAIGATLFEAVIVDKSRSPEDYHYKPFYYDRIDELVENSELIKEAEPNLHPDFIRILGDVLKKSLCSRNLRYQSCEDMERDLQLALDYLIPAEISERSASGKKWVLADAEKILDTNKNISFALQHHLFEKPLFSKRNNNSDNINILIIGFGMFGQKFLDVVLQVAQIPGKTLNVRIVSKSENDYNTYLKNRPELSRFFKINGATDCIKESYGNIYFEKHEFSLKDSIENKKYIDKIYSGKSEEIDYVFVAIGKDKNNHSLSGLLDISSNINFVCEGKHNSKYSNKDFTPVYVSDDIKEFRHYRELERMAFNVHLIWEKNLNIKFSNIRFSFRKPYNHFSCVSFVIAMKYKLYGLGMDFDLSDIHNTARKYYQIIISDSNIKRQLICYEHRRWVTEKICLGYTQIKDLNKCINGITKDEKKKQHICIVSSTLAEPLRSKDWYNSSSKEPVKEHWDTDEKKSLSELDELDKMSVMLHRMYLKSATESRKNNIFNDSNINEINSFFKEDTECQVAFQELLSCMKDLWNNDSDQCKRYEGLRQNLKRLLKESDSKRIKENLKIITEELRNLHTKFFPVYASQQYNDYKLDDAKLVEGIPFILTYSEVFYLVIPYNQKSSGSNDDFFGNLATATVLNPSNVIYVYYCREISELDQIKKSLSYLSNYMKKKEIRSTVEFVIGVPKSFPESSTCNIDTVFSELSSGRVKKVRIEKEKDESSFAQTFTDYMLKRQRNKLNFIVEHNNTNFSGILKGLWRDKNSFSTFRYNSDKMKFEDTKNCDVVTYIKAKPYITTADMLSLNNAFSLTNSKHEFYKDYKELWQEYRSNTSAWKQLCKALKEYSSKNDLMVSFGRFRSSGETKKYRYIIPTVCKSNVVRIIDALKSEKIIDEQSQINSLTTTSCEVLIYDKYSNKKEFDLLFSKNAELMCEEYLFCDINDNDHVVKIIYNGLHVSGLKLMYGERVRGIIKFLCSINYLINYSEESDVSFTYATPQIKDLLTMEGRMLEVYVYHKIVECGLFNDVKSSFEVTWEDSISKNEFDCIITKGFSSLFIECKATRAIKNEYYIKLSALCKKMGINAIPVLIADTQDIDEESKERNDAFRNHGEQFDVITISDRADINNIGVKLNGIISKK